MKKILITLTLALLLASCGVSNNETNKKPVEPVNNNQVENNQNSQNDDTQNIDLSEDDEKMINDIL
jgi:PBP1b-binding outer membrane lipoprotein LpoB